MLLSQLPLYSKTLGVIFLPSPVRSIFVVSTVALRGHFLLIGGQDDTTQKKTSSFSFTHPSEWPKRSSKIMTPPLLRHLSWIQRSSSLLEDFPDSPEASTSCFSSPLAFFLLAAQLRTRTQRQQQARSNSKTSNNGPQWTRIRRTWESSHGQHQDSWSVRDDLPVYPSPCRLISLWCALPLTVFVTMSPAFFLSRVHRLTRELTEAQKKMKDSSVEADKKTFLKAQIPKMEGEIKSLKAKVADLLDSDELDPRGEYFLLAQKLTK